MLIKMESQYRILCIDDDINMLNSSEDILTAAGYEVSLSKSGAQAIKLLQKGIECDLVLLDVDMSEMDGFKTYEEIRNTKGGKDIPIIFVTGMDTPDFEIRGLEIGASDYIVKPFVVDVLLARIKSQLRKSAKQTQTEQVYNKQAYDELKRLLTDTEFMVAICIADGMDNQEIADKTHYSYGYVKRVTSSILSKLELSKRSEIRGMLKR